MVFSSFSSCVSISNYGDGLVPSVGHPWSLLLIYLFTIIKSHWDGRSLLQRQPGPKGNLVYKILCNFCIITQAETAISFSCTDDDFHISPRHRKETAARLQISRCLLSDLDIINFIDDQLRGSSSLHGFWMMHKKTVTHYLEKTIGKLTHCLKKTMVLFCDNDIINVLSQKHHGKEYMREMTALDFHWCKHIQILKLKLQWFTRYYANKVDVTVNAKHLCNEYCEWSPVTTSLNKK